MKPLIPRPWDQKQLKRERKTKQKMYNQKKTKPNLLENNNVQKSVKIPKKTKNSKKHKMTVYIFFLDEM